MTRAAPLLLAGLLLAGCGFMQVGERPIPSVAGAVATTAWQAQDVSQVTEEEEAAAADLTSPDAYLAFVVSFAEANGGPPGELRSGILNRDGDEAIAYLQQPNSDERSELLAYDARLTMERRDDGTWTLTALETREVCAVPVTDGSCGDNSGG
jgi:hypothetical protein